jgi:hypothetical protein
MELQLGDVFAEITVLLRHPLAEFTVFLGHALPTTVPILLLLDHMERQLLDLGQSFGLGAAYANAVLPNFRFGGDIGKTVVRLDVGIHLAQRPEAVAGAEDIIGPAGVRYNHFLCSDCSVNRKAILRGRRPDAHIP